MATPAFGFSAGDFISAISKYFLGSAVDLYIIDETIDLVNKVRKSLKDAGGAASEYQSAFIELENLATTLSHLEAIQPNEDNIQHVNAIRAMAMACKFPLEEFRRKMTSYESSLGPLARRKSLHTIGQKVKWSVIFAEDVEKLRASIAAKHVSINLLLGMQTSKTSTKMSAEMRSSNQRLENKIAEHHSILYSVQERTRNMDDRIKLAQAADHEILESIHTGVDRLDHSVVQARHFGQQIMDCLSGFSGKIQGLLRAILQSNLQTYQLILQMQQNISPRPTNLLESNIRFEDALGEIKELPYEYFRHWVPFEGFLRAHFRHKPGENKIVNSQYYIVDSANKKTIIEKHHWTRHIREGATISMSMIMCHIKTQSGLCPRPGCSAAGSRAGGTSNTLYCNTCSLEFFLLGNDLEESFGRITVLPEDEEIAEKQISEDMSLYGSRPNPLDALEENEYTRLSNLPSKRSAAEFDAAVNRPAKVRRIEGSEKFNSQRVTAMDWNCGATPLDAWLNQSAVPSIVPLPQTQSNQLGSSSDDLAAKELEDLKVFRTIHIKGNEEPKSNGTPQNSAIDLTVLEPRTQIYLRNTLDRYPLLPSYLALRLAKANCARANRLDLKRHDCGDQLPSKPVQVSGRYHSPWTKRRFFDYINQSPKPLGRIQDSMNPPDVLPLKPDKPRPYTCATCDRCFAFLKDLNRHHHSHKRALVCELCFESYNIKRELREHHQRIHMTSPLSSCEFRYHVTLNAPTDMIRQADETPVTYLNKGQAYAVTIYDSKKELSIGSYRYRTVFRISFDDEQQRQNSSACWKLWKVARGLPEAYRSGKLQAIEYLGLNPGEYTEIGKPSIELETASLDCFSVTWSPTRNMPTVSCSILVQFNFLSTDFSLSKGVKGVPVRLYARTEDLSFNATDPLSSPTAEICFCKIKVFRDHGAERKLSNDVIYVKKTIDKLEQQTALIQNNNKDIDSATKGVNHQPGKVPEYVRTWAAPSQGSDGRSAATEDLHTELARMRHMLSLSRPTSVLDVKGGERDGPNDLSVLFPGESTFRAQPISRSACLSCDVSDHQLENCPFRKRKSSTSRANVGFWTVGGSRSRAASVHSQSSDRNNSLHGSGRLDLEDQDLSFPDDRSRRSSASFSESSTTFPPPPVCIQRTRYSPADGGNEIMDQVPKPLSFFCDICEQEIEVMRRRDWQTHVLQDLQPYVCTVEDCDEPTTQFNSRRSRILHEIRRHEMGPGDFNSDLLERKLKESAVGMCVFCGERTGGKDNNREKHIGRHMEEIAFAVVRKPYEEWDFYSDSSGLAHHDIESDTQANA